MRTLHTSCEPRVFSVAPFQACVGSEKGRFYQTVLLRYLCYQALDPSCQSFKSAIPAFASKIALSSVLNYNKSFPGKIELEIVRIGSVPSAGSSNTKSDSLAVHYDMLIACPYGYRVLLQLVLWMRISICSSQGNGKNIFGLASDEKLHRCCWDVRLGHQGKNCRALVIGYGKAARLHHRIHRQPLTHCATHYFMPHGHIRSLSREANVSRL